MRMLGSAGPHGPKRMSLVAHSSPAPQRPMVSPPNCASTSAAGWPGGMDAANRRFRPGYQPAKMNYQRTFNGGLSIALTSAFSQRSAATQPADRPERVDS